eukprot:SAG11_NODE_4188_length_2022_cov_4.568903_3_plen_93_part_00
MAWVTQCFAAAWNNCVLTYDWVGVGHPLRLQVCLNLVPVLHCTKISSSSSLRRSFCALRSATILKYLKTVCASTMEGPAEPGGADDIIGSGN